MRYQAFRKMSTGEWTDALFTTAGDSFTAKETASRGRDIAAALGIPVTDLQEVSRTTDPRRGTYLALPVTQSQLTQDQIDYSMATTQRQRNTVFARVLGLT